MMHCRVPWCAVVRLGLPRRALVARTLQQVPAEQNMGAKATVALPTHSKRQTTPYRNRWRGFPNGLSLGQP